MWRVYAPSVTTSIEIVASSTASAAPIWISTAIAAVPIIAGICSAVIASRSARSVKRTEAEAQRVRDLENRISERKLETYQPVIEVLGDLFDPAKMTSFADNSVDFQVTIKKFMTWVAIYGSDDAVEAYRNIMQASFYDAPPFILARLVAEFIVAARKDIGRSDTNIGPIHVMGMRIRDIYTEREYFEAMTLPFPQVCKKYGWVIPWDTKNQSRAVSAMPQTQLAPTDPDD